MDAGIGFFAVVLCIIKFIVYFMELLLCCSFIRLFVVLMIFGHAERENTISDDGGRSMLPKEAFFLEGYKSSEIFHYFFLIEGIFFSDSGSN